MAAWLTTQAETLLYWVDAPGDEEGLAEYLAAAREACEAFGPAQANPDVIPESWVIAQAMQAQNLWNSAQAAPSGDFDGSGYGLTAHPLDWQVKQLLRPRRAIGAIA